MCPHLHFQYFLFETFFLFILNKSYQSLVNYINIASKKQLFISYLGPILLIYFLILIFFFPFLLNLLCDLVPNSYLGHLSISFELSSQVSILSYTFLSMFFFSYIPQFWYTGVNILNFLLPFLLWTTSRLEVCMFDC